jgi:protein phosphatase
MADILSGGTPDFAAVELVRASLESGSTDNVTCIVADVAEETPPEDLVPLLVGAAADLPRRMPLGGAVGGLFRGHRSGDTGEIAPIPADVPEGAFAADPIDPETARYAPRDPGRHAWLRRLLGALVLLGLAWVVLAAGWSWSQQQFYVAEQDGKVTIFRGIDADLPGISLSHAYEITDVELDRLGDIEAETVREGIPADDLDDARQTVDLYAARQDVDQE